MGEREGSELNITTVTAEDLNIFAAGYGYQQERN